MQRAIGVLVFLLGLVLGSRIPDADQTIGLVHRSIITHILIIPFICFVAYIIGDIISRHFAIGMSIASAIHLSFDLFPQGWSGFALIYIPLLGRTSPTISWLFIAIGIILGAFIALVCIQDFAEGLLSFISALITFNLSALDENYYFFPLLAFLVAIVIALCLSPIARQRPQRYR